LKLLSKRVWVGAFGVSIIGGFVALGALNPTVAFAPAPRTPSELLADPSFDSEINGPWKPKTASKPDSYRSFASGAERYGEASGTVFQDVALTPVNGRAYRFSLHVAQRLLSRFHVAAGYLRLQTACASGEERAETKFDFETGASKTEPAPDLWREVSVTLTPRTSKNCSMRVEIVSSGFLRIDNSSMTDALLDDPSFESGAPQWKLTKGTDGATFTTQPAPDASDGGAIGVLKAGASPVSIIQDLPLDLSSEAVLGTFTTDVRSSSKQPVDIALRAYEPCGPKITEFKVTVSSVWTPLGVQQQRVPGSKGELPPDPKDLIRPFGPACVFRVEVAVLTPGATVQLDSALLDLRTYNSPQGSPRYQALIKNFIEAETEATQKLAQDEAVRQAQLPSARRNP
jgi:hypothetical protein